MRLTVELDCLAQKKKKIETARSIDYRIQQPHFPFAKDRGKHLCSRRKRKERRTELPNERKQKEGGRGEARE